MSATQNSSISPFTPNTVFEPLAPTQTIGKPFAPQVKISGLVTSQLKNAEVHVSIVNMDTSTILDRAVGKTDSKLGVQVDALIFNNIRLAGGLPPLTNCILRIVIAGKTFDSNPFSIQQ